jgi:hypothetical protein
MGGSGVRGGVLGLVVGGCFGLLLGVDGLDLGALLLVGDEEPVVVLALGVVQHLL